MLKEQSLILRGGGVNFAFHTNKEQNPWWELTLDKPRYIRYIILHNRKDTCKERARKLKTEVFYNNEYHVIYEGDLLFDAEPSGVPLILPYKYSEKIEKIKITLQNEESLHLSHVNVLSIDNSKKYLCAFADSGLPHVISRFKLQADQMKSYNKVFFYTEEELNSDFRTYFSDKLKVNRGFGYWVWKPQIILQTLEQLNEGEILQYIDAGSHLNPLGFQTLHDYFTLTNNSDIGIVAFKGMGIHVEKKYTKGDLFDYFNVRYRDDVYDTNQVSAGTFFIRKCKKSINIIENWLKVYYNDFSLVDDTPSKSPNFNGFYEGRHDQSVFSLLSKINGVDIIGAIGSSEEQPFLFLRDRNRVEQKG
jgi:hypothetical protein